MTETSKRLRLDQPAVYQIRVQGELSQEWIEWFEGLEINVAQGITTLSGDVVDQAALHGLLVKIRDLGLPLLSINLL